eukprot:CAMPEP_0185033448 /NCGR_PEP_ID=MMETSP1103-20130426/22391_1 /TAXON_ID=36769 /ORGANISM="Paraphysomonas bandaiensis, Strain Caron Lab Isolate" /LENGTH=531 /DNA_ID=CAMNT_0027569721 /DNA_START=274 /DNA_END=1869 /DNA_ORIENTATION=-
MITFNLAALRIQARWRGCIVRTFGKQWRAKIKRKKVRSKKPKQIDTYLAYLDHFSNNRSLSKPAWMEDGYSAWCAVRIQAWWRMIPCRRRFLYIRDINEIAVIEIQTTYRHHVHVKIELERLQRIPSTVKSPDSFCRTIQLAWRTYCNVRVYRYFRDLVLNKLRGAPADLLRTIIPGEADYLDRASGVHVRFRLGGVVFPPKIYYKVFTHRALCDVNAFAPRNYCMEKKIEPFALHNRPLPSNVSTSSSRKGCNASGPLSLQKTSIRVGGAFFESVVTTEENEGWYQRQDNNPWRVVSTDLDDAFAPPPWVSLDTNMTSPRRDGLASKYQRKKKQQAFHYSRLKRQQDVLLERKRRKREWMLKAYMLTAGGKGISGGGSEVASRMTTAAEEAPPDDEDDHRDNQRIEMCDSYDSNSAESKHVSYDYDDEYTDIKGDRAVERIHSKAQVKESKDHKDDSKDSYSDELYHKKYTAPSTHPSTDDALLKWSMALDFEEYSRDWVTMATSMPSDANYEAMYDRNLQNASLSRSHK